jgi:putative PIG3 family NAD(P)H quinone oxidoreductase
MQAIILTQFGGPEVLTFSEIPTPQPGPEQLLVRVKATALNRADLLQRKGKYPPPADESNIPGLEISGEVAAIGKDVTDYKVGDRVFGLVGSGAYAEYCIIDHQVAMPIPESLSYIEAAAIAEAFLTASEAIFSLGNLQPDESILIHAGGSGVGTAGIQLAKQIGATVFTTVGSADKQEKLNNAFHPDGILNYKQEDFAETLQQLTKQRGVNVIIDFIGASYLAKNLESLQSQGRLICVGLMGGTKTEIDLARVQKQRLQIKGLVMRVRSLAEKRMISQHFIQRWLPLFAEGKLKPVIDSVFPFADIQAAHTRMESNLNFGKIVLEVS